ncbi:helix-turn-helix domain-containing protein [Cellulosilyticum sp. ST5]|uniref:helix-turn-helix domain-containing protein n=1 Tax=Cellulosilyticum sp. ST5 TaxID=3055805 RepID=UPI0039778A51
MELGEHIRLARHCSELTQKELAKRAGLSEITIRKYEKGERKPKIEQLRKIAKALGQEPDYFLSNDNKRVLLINDVNTKLNTYLKDNGKDTRAIALTQLIVDYLMDIEKTHPEIAESDYERYLDLVTDFISNVFDSIMLIDNDMEKHFLFLSQANKLLNLQINDYRKTIEL